MKGTMLQVATLLLAVSGATRGADERPAAQPEAMPSLATAADLSGGTPADPREDLRNRRDAAHQRLLRLMDEDRASEGVPVALQVVELTRALDGDGSPTLAVPLTNLATAQLRSGDLLAAESNYTAAVALIERTDGIVSPRLLNPLLGLGETYRRGSQYVQAADAYQRGLRVSHVNEGLYNLDQVRIRDGLTESYLGQDDLEQANLHQEAQLLIHERKLGPGHTELVPVLYKLGAWYERSGQFGAARGTYQSAVKLLAATRGENDPAMVEALLQLAGAYRQQAMLVPDPDSGQIQISLLPMAASTLRRALAIADRQPRPDPVLRSRVLVALGDLYMLSDRQASADEHYARAWNVLSAPATAEHRAEFFGLPQQLAGPALPAEYPPRNVATPTSRNDLEPGYVVARYSVDATGHVSDAVIIEADPGGLLDDRVTANLRRTLFRPRYVDGRAVDTEGLTLRHEFGYRSVAGAPGSRQPARSGGEPLPLPSRSPAGTSPDPAG